ncbi:MAG: hypothetical protein V3W34_02000 [Phycisphaerae bacterium]
MVRRSLLVFGLAGCISTFASAEVFVEYWPTGEMPNGVNDPIDVDVSNGPVTISIQIGLTAPGGQTQMLGADFVFTWPAGFDMANFQWDAGLDASAGWFQDTTLPAPAITSFFPTAPIPVGPDPQLTLATVDVSIEVSVAPGTYSIDTTPTVNDVDFSEFVLDQGSGAIVFNVGGMEPPNTGSGGTDAGGDTGDDPGDGPMDGDEPGDQGETDPGSDDSDTGDDAGDGPMDGDGEDDTATEPGDDTTGDSPDDGTGTGDGVDDGGANIDDQTADGQDSPADTAGDGDEVTGDEDGNDAAPGTRSICGIGMIGPGLFALAFLSVMKLNRRRVW